MTYVAASGTARIQHADTGEVFEIDSDELDFEAIGADERNMGPEIHHQAELEHPELGTLTWGLWEYPVGIENMTETEIGPHTILEDIDYGLRHEPDEEEPPEKDEPDLPLLLGRLPAQIDALDHILARFAELQPRIGHNHPPEEHRLALTDLEIGEIRTSLKDLRAQAARPNAIATADPVTIQLAQTRLSKLSTTLATWGKMATGALTLGVLGGLGKGVGDHVWQQTPMLHHLVDAIQHTLALWIHALMALL